MRLWGVYPGGETAVMAETRRHAAVGPCKQPEPKTRCRETGAALPGPPGAPTVQIQGWLWGQHLPGAGCPSGATPTVAGG